MAGRRPPSDLGSDWINVPRKFRGIKDTSSPTELAYITGAEKGLLSRFAKANQVGPENIPSYDDSGVSADWLNQSKYDERKKSGWTPTKSSGASVYTIPGVKDVNIKSTVAKAKTQRGPMDPAKRNYGTKQTYGVDKVKDEDRMSGPEMNYGDVFDKDVDLGGDDPGGTKKTVTCTGGQIPDGKGGCKDPASVTQGDCDSGQEKVNGKCVPVCGEGQTRVDGVCKSETPNGCNPPCGEGQKCVDNKCVNVGGDDNGGETPSLTTILKPDQTPMLQTLTNEMDLRNMLSNVLNKNNPLFKQARTRALQAMAGRGIVNSSMAEEAVMSAVMNVAMPIATRVIDDLQRVMAANVNASNAFKQALNQAYYEELVTRVDAANKWNLQKMMESQEWSRSMLTAKAGAAGIKDEKQFKRYMDMLSGAKA